MRSMTSNIVLILVALMISGCASGLVCRHRVLTHYGWALEEGYRPEIVVYETSRTVQLMSLGMYDRHAQVRIKRAAGRFVWLDDNGLRVTMSETPTYVPGRQWVFTLAEYMSFMSGYHAAVASNKARR
jgi:hypothetical protein